MLYKMDEHYQHVDDYEMESQSQSEGDIPFWRELIKRYSPTHVLELACGSGRIGIELLHGSEAFYLEGLDKDENMLAAYRGKLEHEPDKVKSRVILHHGDMANYDLRNRDKFDFIFLPFNSLGHLYEARQQLDAFRKTYEHLAPGGRFVVDIYLPRNCSGDAFPQTYLDQQIKSVDGTFTLLVYSVHQYNRYEQIDHITFIHEKFFVSGPSERYLTHLDVRAFFPGELQLLFLTTGFDIEAIYGGYSFESFEQGTRQIIVGRKRGS